MRNSHKKLSLAYLVFYFLLATLLFFAQHHHNFLEKDSNCAICNWAAHFSFILPVLSVFLAGLAFFSFVFYFFSFFNSQNFNLHFLTRSPPNLS